MKQFLLSLFVLTTISFTSNAERVLEGRAAYNDVRGAETVRYKDHLSIPAFIKFRENDRIAFSSWEAWMTEHYFEDATHIGFALVGTETDRLGMVHYRFKQTANGHPLYFGTWIVHTLNNEVVSMNGVLFDEVPAYQAGLSEAQALSKALDHVGANSYKWEIPLEEEAVKIIENDPNATYFPQGKLEVINTDLTLREKDLRLAWRFNIYAHEPMSRQDVFVDANSGEIVWTNDLIHHADSNITAVTGYVGTKPITADWTGSQFRLRETGRGNGVQTFNLNNATSGMGSDFFHGDSLWDEASIEKYATDAHYGAEMTYDFFYNHFNRNSINDNGFTLISRVHYGTNYGNAFWNGQVMTYGDGSSGNSPFTAIDIAGHEIAHGLTTFTANLVYADEPGALNESFSDIFGAAVEFDGLGYANGDWLMGEDLGFVIRTMNNPNANGDPDTYEGTYWYVGTGDNGGVHINSGVQNFWFYLLTEGGSGTNDNGDSYSVTGIGLSDAATVAYRNLVVYLTESSEYEDARYYAIQSAVDIFGPCTQQTESTWDAWYAVGIGDEYSGIITADYAADIEEHCQSPAIVNFQNFSTLSTSYTWDFGDGNTSTAFEPTHTYQNDGVYTVSLISSSNCGADSVVYVDLIKVGPAYPCNVSLPANGGLAQTQTGCEGFLYDDGGPAGAYSANYNSTITIAPTNAVAVTLEFIEFDIEADPSCQYDYMTIYDGPSSGSPVIGTYCNTNNPPTFINSTGSAITIQFTTDEGLEEEGFKIGWECSIPSAPPQADFEADILETCQGNVNFSDISAVGENIPTAWYWEFGDGDTASVKNPSHTYSTSGQYTVMMVASNFFGADTVIKTNYISVDKPAAPEGPDVEVCPGDQANLIASSPGVHKWYDSPFGGNPLHIGDTFTTPIVQQSTPFYVEAEVEGPDQFTGAPDNNIGGGAYFNFQQSLYFDVFAPVKLYSVKMYALIPGNRHIQIFDNTGGTVLDTLIDLEIGEQEVVLDVALPTGVDFAITLGDDGIRNCYRSNSGVDFPYEIPGLISIHSSSAQTAPLDYYYFFYDWKVRDFCISDREMISASVGECTGIDEIAAGSMQLFPNPTHGLVRASWENGIAPTTLSVFDAAGAQVRSFQVPSGSNFLDLDLEGLCAGIYLVRGTGNQTVMTQRIILQ